MIVTDPVPTVSDPLTATSPPKTATVRSAVFPFPPMEPETKNEMSPPGNDDGKSASDLFANITEPVTPTMLLEPEILPTNAI